jgi:hypothetical protein
MVGGNRVVVGGHQTRSILVASRYDTQIIRLLATSHLPHLFLRT